MFSSSAERELDELKRLVDKYLIPVIRYKYRRSTSIISRMLNQESSFYEAHPEDPYLAQMFSDCHEYSEGLGWARRLTNKEYLQSILKGLDKDPRLTVSQLNLNPRAEQDLEAVRAAFFKESKTPSQEEPVTKQHPEVKEEHEPDSDDPWLPFD